MNGSPKGTGVSVVLTTALSALFLEEHWQDANVPNINKQTRNKFFFIQFYFDNTLLTQPEYMLH